MTAERRIAVPLADGRELTLRLAAGRVRIAVGEASLLDITREDAWELAEAARLAGEQRDLAGC